MTRYAAFGKIHVVFTLTCGNINAPTVSNITTGTLLDASINDVAGFTFSNNPIEVPDLASSFTSKIPGRDTADDSVLTVYRDSVTNPLDTLAAKDVNGFMIISQYKILGTWASGDKVDVWPVQVGSNAKQLSVGDDPHLAEITFTVTSPPAINVTVA